jgi:hypothetical protein
VEGATTVTRTRRPARVGEPLPAAHVAGAAVVAVGLYGAVFGWAMANTSYDVWGAMVVAPVLVAISLPVLRRAARREPDPRIGQLLVIALVLKLVASLSRYYMAFHLYGGVADASRYHEAGALLGAQLRSGDFDIQLGMRVVGTGFIIILTGIVYAITGPSLIGGYLVYSWLGFWGLFGFYRAFVIAFPDGDRWRYALLLFLLPSMLFWPSGIGKDTWMLLTLGVFAYGAALLLSHRRGGFIVLALAIAGQLAVRPHVAVLACGALLVAYVVRRRPARLTALGPVKSVLVWAVLGAAGLLVIRQVQGFFGADEFSSDTVNQVLSSTEEHTGQGGSAFQNGFNGSPQHLPRAIITVLFRPFPFEAHNIQAFIAAAEGSALLLLFLLSWPRLQQIPRYLRSRPYLAFSITFTLLFCYAFGHFQNFGILTRERVQVFPVLLVLLAIPPATHEVRRRPRRRAEPGSAHKIIRQRSAPS